MKVNGFNYCSDFCAQVDQKHRASDTKSEETVKSSSVERGEPLAGLYAGEKLIAYETSESDHKKEQEKNSTTTQTLNEAERQPVKNSAENITEMFTPQDDVTEKKSLEVIRHAPSVELPVTSEMAASESMNLIDDSVKHLHGLMKSVGSHLKERANTLDSRNAFVDPALVNSACNCAKQIAQLLKVKLEMKKFKA